MGGVFIWSEAPICAPIAACIAETAPEVFARARPSGGELESGGGGLGCSLRNRIEAPSEAPVAACVAATVPLLEALLMLDDAAAFGGGSSLALGILSDLESWAPSERTAPVEDALARLSSVGCECVHLFGAEASARAGWSLCVRWSNFAESARTDIPKD